MKELINLRIDETDLEKLKEIARKEDRTVSWIIRKAIFDYIKGKN